MSRYTCALVAALLLVLARPSTLIAAHPSTLLGTALSEVEGPPPLAAVSLLAIPPTDAPSAAAAVAAPSANTMPDSRLRGLAPPEQRLLRNALAESATVRDLANRVQQSDLIVMVHIGMLETGLTGTTQLLSCAGGVRYVLVKLDPRATPTERVANLGHELRHVVEIADAPEVKTADQMKQLFEHIGWRSGRDDRWETRGAIEAGRQVMREVLEHGTRVGADDDAG